MSNSKWVPNIRFKKFKIQWDKYKFADILDKNNGIRRGPFGSSLRKDSFVNKSDYVVYEQQNAIYNMYKTRYNINKSKFEELQKFELRPGDFIMSGAGTIGKISEVPVGIKQGVFNQALIRFKINKKTTSRTFFLTFMRSYIMQRKMTEKNPGSAISNLVSIKEVKNFSIIIPDKQEQQKIGEFFTKLDKLLDLQKQKIEKLDLLKKALLQKLFPKNNAKIPELRFKYFKDNWESKTFKNILNYERPDKYIVKSDNYSNNGIPVLTANKSFILGYIQESNFYDKSLPVIIFDDFTLDCKLVRFPFKIKSSAIKILSPNNFSDIWFDFYLLKATSFIKEGHARHYISIVQNKIINVPRKIEQQKIGNLLSKVDQLIELENKKLHNLQQVKKCLLQNMFVE